MPDATPHPPRLALVGDRSQSVAAHERIPVVVESLGLGATEPIEVYWLHSTSIAEVEDVALFDGVWVIPGSPYEHREGVLLAIESARTNRIPLLGTCGGFQHLMLEFARNVCGLPTVEHGEQFADADELLIVPLPCSLLGEEATVTVEPGTTAGRAMGGGSTTERFFCRFGLNSAYLEILQANGLVISGRDEFGDARIAELPDHPFYVGSLFQPELSSDATWVHPLIVSFAAAVRAHAASVASAPTGNRSRPVDHLEGAR